MSTKERDRVVQHGSDREHRGDGKSPAPSEMSHLVTKLHDNVATVLLGKPEPIQLCVIALLAGGHVLIEDAPGVGKTSLAKALARSLDCKFTRLQFTPDMLPSDILGSSVYLPNLGEFEFRKGPIFTNVLLADEINRTTPRTQSALLEAMSEGQVSIEGRTYVLSSPFFVLATQNPYEYAGTYPLPENQLDRFMLCTSIGYPERNVEKLVLASHRDGEEVDRLEPVLTAEELRQMQSSVREIAVDESINEYLLDIIAATRQHDELELGVSTRGALTLYRAAQSMAFVENRKYVIPDDVKRLAIPVLAHRVVCRGLIREGQRERAENIIRRILQQTAVPD
jgi:MoxR-like ATPase